MTMSYSGIGHYPYYPLPPYWEATIFGALALLTVVVLVLFANEKPLARLWKVITFALLMLLLSIASIVEGNSVPGNSWTQPAEGLTTRHAYPSSPLWLSIPIYLLMGLFVILLARDYQWLTWVRLWLDTFVLNKPLPDTSSKPRH